MRLKNKRTGEIIEWEKNITYKVGKTYTSLADFVKDWKDVPNGYYYIMDSGGIGWAPSDKLAESRKSIGNYFETPEEAEKALGKLRALKRLMDNGFKLRLYWGEDE